MKLSTGTYVYWYITAHLVTCNKGKGGGRKKFIMPMCVACYNSRQMNFNQQRTNWEKIEIWKFDAEWDQDTIVFQ